MGLDEDNEFEETEYSEDSKCEEETECGNEGNDDEV